MNRNGRHPHTAASALFRSYVLQLAVRLALLAWGVFLLACDPAQLDPASHFGFAHGLTFIDVVFAFSVVDAATKLFPRARIAMGSRKQYGRFHLPSLELLRSGRAGLSAYLGELREEGAAARDELAGRLADAARRPDAAWIRDLPARLDDLKADAALRADIGRRRAREVVPVAAFWVFVNAAVAAILAAAGWLAPPACVAWMLFYFAFDMVCVVLWCPLQVWFMKNRCCTTCQIFNWDAIMAATPLLFVPGPFSWIIIGLALVVFVRWEAAFLRHPERFDERTNAALRCASCTDKLCRIRKPYDALRRDALRDDAARAGR